MTLFELDLPKEFEKEYLDMIKPDLINRIRHGHVYNGKKYEFSSKVKEILLPGWNTETPDDSIVKQLLIAEPENLKKLNDNIKGKIAALPCRRRASDKDIEIIFNYSGIFDTSSKSKAYKLALKISAPTCCYCNRQYTFTVVKDGNSNKDDRITRPAFDHWFPKSKYPLMSISLYNLIPSCTICNSSAKGSQDVNLDEYIHPYVHKSGHPKIEFIADVATEPDRNWTIKIDREKDSPEDKTIKMFCLDEIYKEHDNLELKDLMDFKDKYPRGFLIELEKFLKDNKLDTVSVTQADVYRMLFGIEMDDTKHLNRPFGKMKSDILKKLY